MHKPTSKECSDQVGWYEENESKMYRHFWNWAKNHTLGYEVCQITYWYLVHNKHFTYRKAELMKYLFYLLDKASQSGAEYN